MGCDIHAYVETKSPRVVEGSDWSFTCMFRLSRHETLFALMSGMHRTSPWPDVKLLEHALAKRGVATLNDPKLSKKEMETIVVEASDSGITRGLPSFDPRGMPKDISWRVVNEYVVQVVPDDEKCVELGAKSCSTSTAYTWLASGSTEAWETEEDGGIRSVVCPDWHTPSWLTAAEVKQVALRFRTILSNEVQTVKKLQAQNVEWASAALVNAEKEGDLERVAYFENELARESDWDTYDPLKEPVYAHVEGLAAMMAELETRGLKSRLVFWFDN